MPAEPQKSEKVFAEEDMSARDLAARVRDLESALAATRAGVPLNLVPEHGAGNGTNFAETWSQADQELARNRADNWPGHPSTFGSILPTPPSR